MRIETFVIHLARAEGRKPQVEMLLAESPYPAEIVDAVDGWALTEADIEKMYSRPSLYRPPYPFVLRKTEMGVFQSHRNAWKLILEKGLSGALILEDDVAFDPNFQKAIAFGEKYLEKYGYIQFQVRQIKDQNIVEQEGQFGIVDPTVTPVRLSAQLVSADAAEQLLKCTECFDRPIDTFMQMHWETKVKPVCIVPSGVFDRAKETGGSTISEKIPFRDRVSREFKRAWYRYLISRLSQRNPRKTHLDKK